MGLDMYLYGRKYLSTWGDDAQLHTEISKVTEGIRKGFKVNFITCEAMYWRKANAIHNWFVKNVQDGQDDCGHYAVTQADLQNLLDVVTEVLDDHSKAHELLPTQSGFFFGNTEYGDWYFQDLQHTKDSLTNLLSKFEEGEIGWDWTFEYHSSW